MTATVGNVGLWVADLERSERFYVDLVGLEVTARVETPDVREVILGSLLLAAGEGRPNPSGLWKIFVQVDDAAGTYERLVGAGADPVQAPTVLERFGITIAMVRDPDGYVVELGQLAS